MIISQFHQLQIFPQFALCAKVGARLLGAEEMVRRATFGQDLTTGHYGNNNENLGDHI